jgi:hypothetical protein
MVQSHAPLEVVQQMFVKLGARYIIVVNPNGFCECNPILMIVIFTVDSRRGSY